jgi:spore coat protein CotF
VKFRADTARFDHEHRWVNISLFPYSRLPPLQENNEVDNPEIANETKLLHSVSKCFVKMGIANGHIEDPELRQLFLTFSEE